MNAKKVIAAFLMIFVLASGFAQETSKKVQREQKKVEKQKQIEDLISSKAFVFEATQALPQGGTMVQLTGSSYTVKFHPDTIESYLPFYGRAYSVDYGGDGGIKFKGKPGEYKVTTQKKGRGYEINATVKVTKDNYDLHLTVSPDGSGILIVNSNQRSSISYHGHIEKSEAVKEE